jgi:CTP synthase
LADSYISVIEALKISAAHLGVKANLVWMSAKHFEDTKNLKDLKDFGGILVPGGFGETGIQGKINVIEYARKNKIPYFGLCYGMQLMVIEYARNVLGLKDANTEEIDPNGKVSVIHIMPDQKEKITRGDYGGSMRLGTYEAVLKEGSVAEKAYQSKKVLERHRHRYEVNESYVEALEKKGLVFSGVSPDGHLMEIAELPKAVHPFFLGTQFHPEFLARPLSPHPLFSAFIEEIKNRK